MTQPQTKPERIVILSKAFGGQWEQQFFNEINDAFADGYRIARTGLRDDASMRNYRGRVGKAVMYLEGYEPEPWKPTETEVAEESPELAIGKEVVVEKEDHTPKDIPIKEEVAEEALATGAAENKQTLSTQDQLKDLTTSKDLRAFAEDNGVEVADGVKNPKAIKKAIKDALKTK